MPDPHPGADREAGCVRRIEHENSGMLGRQSFTCVIFRIAAFHCGMPLTSNDFSLFIVKFFSSQ